MGGKESLYGLHDDTLDSLVLSLLPPVGFQEFLETDKPQKEEDISTEESPDVFLLRRLLRALRKRAGFRLPHVRKLVKYICEYLYNVHYYIHCTYNVHYT